MLTCSGVHGTTTVVPNTFFFALFASMLAVSCIEGVLHFLELSELVDDEFSSISVIIVYFDKRGQAYFVAATD